MTPVAKRLAVALAVSVALNLLAAGFWLGRHLHGPRQKWQDSELGVERRGWRHPTLRHAFEQHRGDVMARRESARAARKAVSDALEHEPFDAAALERALADVRAQTEKNQELFHRALLDAARSGTPEARRSLARSFAR